MVNILQNIIWRNMEKINKENLHIKNLWRCKKKGVLFSAQCVDCWEKDRKKEGKYKTRAECKGENFVI